MAENFGGEGFLVRSEAELREVLGRVWSSSGVKVVNVMIEPGSVKKPQENFWLSLKDPKL